ncbi:FMN-binding negative transcriptional regulator [Tenacibaculum caenipelagi]|uniref:PaiB family negative transcriptional regulator n=1 Tax=Tenacibaculum caenipelagi TaxID=1325435 RepID=A0A4R6TC93_9FLAO|nr:FMN-binding negative transcriptional regulator [Tenacibaculum caenipelagi]TDQ25623.1 PaiB family negative transcriptional regulator [Tenacibaculum caenipelagi]
MHIPSIFKFEDDKEKIAFMKKYSFATIITNKGSVPIATQLPFVVKEDSGKLVLSGHFGVANEQVKFIENNTSLVIFTEPHAYISPVHYEKNKNVPTWDYISVHAYGEAKVIHDNEKKLSAIEEMINFYEKDYQKQWSGLPEGYKNGMLRGIVAFELEVTELQGQQKLSQNRTEKEIERITEHLENSEVGTEKDLAQYIKSKNYYV